MLLTIDAGNTNVVFAVYDGERPLGRWRISTDGRRTSDEYAVWLMQLMGTVGLKPAHVAGAIFASVVPAVSFNLMRLCRERFGCEPMVVGAPDCDLGIEVLLDNPKEVGADRLVNAIEATATFGAPLIVIDFGTATTFDVVDAQGNYRGGVICPGIYLSIEALHNAAALLPKVDVVKTDKVIATSTIQAMQAGVFWGYVGMIEGVVSRMKHEFGSPMAVIGTGGLAGIFSEATDVIDNTDGDLTLRGLRRIYQRNRRA